MNLSQGVTPHIQFIRSKGSNILLGKLFVISLIVDEVYLDIIELSETFPDHDHVPFLRLHYSVASPYIPLYLGVHLIRPVLLRPVPLHPNVVNHTRDSTLIFHNVVLQELQATLCHYFEVHVRFREGVKVVYI